PLPPTDTSVFLFDPTPPTPIHTLSLHDALPIWVRQTVTDRDRGLFDPGVGVPQKAVLGEFGFGEVGSPRQWSGLQGCEPPFDRVQYTIGLLGGDDGQHRVTG